MLLKKKNTIFLLIITSISFILQAKQKNINSFQVKNSFVSKKKLARDKVVSVSIPKCGTHLLLKCISLLNIKGFSYDYVQEARPNAKQLQKIREINKNLPPNHYKGTYCIPVEGPLPKITMTQLKRELSRKLFLTHWPYTKEFENALFQRTFANFITIRDPRDMVISFAFMVYKSRDGKVADLNKIILDLITGRQQYYLPWAVEIHQAYPLIWEKGLYEFYRMYLPWIASKNFMLIKFENLIGQKGGGSFEKQFKTIAKVAQNLGFTITAEKIKSVIDNLFGGTWTFREGQIGGWKKYFTPEIKNAFKRDFRLTKLLIDLEYEQDTNW